MSSSIESTHFFIHPTLTSMENQPTPALATPDSSGACNGAFHPIDAELYGHLATGNVGGFHQLISSRQLNVYELRCSRDRSNVLHIAASLGQAELVIDLLNHWPELMVRANSKGDLAIHSALKAGRLDTVDVLMKTNTGQVNIATLGHVYGWKNEEGNTALHITLENDELEITKHLVELYPPACYMKNKKDVCPLYMVVTKELLDLFQLMLTSMHPFAEEVRSVMKKCKSIVHAAVSAARTEFLEHLLKNYPELIDSLDEEGRTPMSYVAYMGDIVKAQLLLRMFRHCAFIRDEGKDGSFPIHQAANWGYIDIIEELTTSRFLLNAKGQNILHVAAQSGDSDVVKYLLRQEEVDQLINQKDEDGNSPLHLATLEKHPSVVAILIQDNRVKVGLSNKDGLTAYDMVKKPAKSGPDEKVLKGLRLIFNGPKESGEKFPIDNELYGLLVNGDINQVNQIILQRGLRLDDLECPQDNNTVLHVAATVDQPGLISDVLEKYDCSRLMRRANKCGDLPLHSAAKGGKLQAVQALFEQGNIQAESCGTLLDREGNTALHIALLNHHKEMANYLLHRYPLAAFCSNWDKICPLFLAIKDSYWDDLVTDMIHYLSDTKYQSLLKAKKSVVHAAICTRKDDILDKLITRAPELINLFDTRGRSPLSYEAHMGYEREVQLLLARYPALAFNRDNDLEDGSFPIHQAAKGGHVKIIKLLYSTALSLNNKCQNILHVAAKAGSSDVVSHLLKMQEFKDLINVSDQDGNTALHLAVRRFYPKIVYILTLEKSINVNSINKDLWTAYDLLQYHRQYPGQEFHYRWAICKLILKQVGGKNSHLPGRIKNKNKNKVEKPSSKKSSSSESKRIRERLSTLLLAATLIATMTFAAGFTLPGGYNQSNPNIGMATLARKWAFQVFVICDTVAFFSSFVAAVMTVRGMHDTQDVEVKYFCAGIGCFLINGALIMMPMAFMSGTFVVLRGKLWLGIVVLVVGFFSLLVSLIAVLVSVAPSFKSIRFRRYLFFLDQSYLLLLFYHEGLCPLDSTI